MAIFFAIGNIFIVVNVKIMANNLFIRPLPTSDDRGSNPVDGNLIEHLFTATIIPKKRKLKYVNFESPRGKFIFILFQS